jgi:lipoprotein-anchoring transpeptidase ErfK/SrfK
VAALAGVATVAFPGAGEAAGGPPETVALTDVGRLARWAPVNRPVVVRRAPHANAETITRLKTLTPEYTTNLVLLLERVTDDTGRQWVRVRLPVLPNNTTGWVPRSALGRFHVVRTHLVVDRARLTATLYKDGKQVFRASTGIGKPRWPTPRGEFYVRNKIVGFSAPMYGPVAFGTSARSTVLTDWPGGGHIGIHGTDAPHLLPGRVSHGCIRLRNRAIRRLARLLPVGTPLTIR